MLSIEKRILVMASAPPNRVRELRELRGLSQQALAAAASLSRQSVGAIEAGRATPAVDVALRLARALDCRVEELFALGDADRLTPEPAAPALTGRVALAHIAGRWVAHSLDRDALRLSADAVVVPSRRGRLEVERVRPEAEARDNLVMMGCAAALGLLADRLNARPGAGRFLWLARASTPALAALADGHTHLAGVHLVDGATGEANVPDVRRHTGAAVVLITLACWEAGLVAAAGNPKKIRDAADLGRRGLRLVTREPGSGARRLLERELARARVDLAATRHVQAPGHLEVAQAVAIGAGDVGVATRDAAIAHGLHFVPLAEERYDLVIPRDSQGDPRISRLLDAMTASAFRRELSTLGYDVRPCGERVAELAA
jgi:molybdate-binding protein/DNA-binding XRE family transcriptional regulator